MHIPVTSLELRTWANECAMQANDARTSGDERDRLLRMRDGLLSPGRGTGLALRQPDKKLSG
jgi:hypothetical protein